MNTFEKVLFAVAIFLNAHTGSFTETINGVRKQVTITEVDSHGGLDKLTLFEAFQIADAILIPGATDSFVVRGGAYEYQVSIVDEPVAS